jgi:hypothetical protein
VSAKRIMRAFKIHEISGVRLPAQKGALAAIMKAAADPPRHTEQRTLELSQSSQFIQKFGVDFNKAAISDHLESIAKNRAREKGESFAKAYQTVLDGEMGRELYNAYTKAPAGVAPAVEEPVAPALSKAAVVSAELESMARAHSAKHGISIGRAMDAVLQTPEGRQKYSQMRAA